MKKFIHKVQDLSQKAAQMKQAIQGAPAKAAELREAMTAAAGQLHQLRSDVQSSIQGLRTEGDDRLANALREVDNSHDLFQQAGYVVQQVEMELGLAQRLIVHLEKVEDVPHHLIRSLLGTQDSRKTTHAILVALLKAEELAEKVELEHLTYYQLTVYAGLTPSVRLCWGADVEEETHSEHAHAHVHAPGIPSPAMISAIPAPPPPLPAATSAFTQTSYLAPAAPSLATAVPVPIAPTAAPVASAPAAAGKTAEAPAPAGDFGRSALERFKKMPDLSKYRR